MSWLSKRLSILEESSYQMWGMQGICSQEMYWSWWYSDQWEIFLWKMQVSSKFVPARPYLLHMKGKWEELYFINLIVRTGPGRRQGRTCETLYIHLREFLLSTKYFHLQMLRNYCKNNVWKLQCLRSSIILMFKVVRTSLEVPVIGPFCLFFWWGLTKRAHQFNWFDGWN